jgi:hypothetical protein
MEYAVIEYAGLPVSANGAGPQTITAPDNAAFSSTCQSSQQLAMGCCSSRWCRWAAVASPTLPRHREKGSVPVMGVSTRRCTKHHSPGGGLRPDFAGAPRIQCPTGSASNYCYTTNSVIKHGAHAGAGRLALSCTQLRVPITGQRSRVAMEHTIFRHR